MDNADSREEHSRWLETHNPLLWRIIYKPDVCPEYGTPKHIELGGSVGPVYESPRYLERKNTPERGLSDGRIP